MKTHIIGIANMYKIAFVIAVVSAFTLQFALSVPFNETSEKV